MKTKTLNPIVKVALIALLWAMVVVPGELFLYTTLRLNMAHAWWTGTEEVAPPPGYQAKVRGDIQFGVIGADSKRVIAYDVGQSMLMLPGDWVGQQLHQVFPAIASQTWRQWAVLFLIFAPINMAVVVASYWLLKLFNFDSLIAAVSSLILFLGTTVLHYAQAPQHNNQLLVLVVVGYATALAYVLKKQNYLAVLSGAALGLAVLIRTTSTLHTLNVLLFLGGCVFYQNGKWQEVVKALGIWLGGHLPLVFLSRYIDYLRYGSFWLNGKIAEKQQLATDPVWSGLPDLPAGYPLINPPSEGILGVLLSPAKSIFVYDPLLIPCLVIGVLLWRKLHPFLQWYLVTVVINIGLHLVAYSRFVFWHGDSAWASRYHVTSAHLLMIPLLGLLVQWLLNRRELYGWLLRGIIVFAIVCQLASVAIPHQMEVTQKQVNVPGSRLDFRLAQRFLNVGCLLNDSLSARCTTRIAPETGRYLRKYNRFAFLPFTFLAEDVTDNPSLKFIYYILLIAWTVMAIAAVWLTVSYLYSVGFFYR